MPPRSNFMEKNPLPKSSYANISAPDVANFFKLHPIPYTKESKPPVLRPTLMGKKGPSQLPGNMLSGTESIPVSQDKTYGFVTGGNEKKRFV